MARAVAVDVLLGLAVVVVLACSAGVLLMRDAYQKLHYVTPVSMVAPVTLLRAVTLPICKSASSPRRPRSS